MTHWNDIKMHLHHCTLGNACCRRLMVFDIANVSMPRRILESCDIE